MYVQIQTRWVLARMSTPVARGCGTVGGDMPESFKSYAREWAMGVVARR